ncbi:PilW family protein [Guyparkeria halophila]|uniref:PilW family protein n=1 Tax=Guyparkeria halophila TaxID=47960 RepID=A0ABZ0YWN2_9GAMM|nr:PilW family protein [Guyparkeria halophila]WQH16587.1 PilW family protein [Guyparkeria halophila]
MIISRDSRRGQFPGSGRRLGGFTLVELMIALVLGLLVIAGVGSVFIANKDAYRTNEALSQVQDASRTAFEFVARDVREAGSNPCGAANVASVLDSPSSDWLDWSQPFRGFDDVTDIDGLPGAGEIGEPVDEHALRLGKAEDSGIALEAVTGPRANITLESATSQISDGDILMVCDADKATIFQTTNYNSNNTTLVHNTGGSYTPGNLTKCLNHPVPQLVSGGNCTTLSPTSYLVVPTNTVWYIGTNAAGTRSLFRSRNFQSTAPVPEEMVRGVEGMEIEYHRSGEDVFETATQVDAVGGGWEQVDAARITLTVRSRGLNPSDPDFGSSTDRERLQRDFSTTIAIRNRLGG